MSSLSRFCCALAATLMLGLIFPATLLAQAQTPSVLISEFRFRGLAGGNDEFIEFYNNSDTAITVTDTAPDTNATTPDGWALVAVNATNTTAIRFVIPNGTVIPPRGHFLAVNTAASGYSLGAYAAGDQVAAPSTGTLSGGYTTGIVDGGGIALFSTANPANIPPTSTTSPNTFRLDAVGFNATQPLFFEGTALSPSTGLGTTNGEYSLLRKMNTGFPQDTNDNQADFDFVSTTAGTFNTRVSILGAPGPENLASPVQRNAVIKASLINGALPPSASPNRVRSGQPVTNGSFGTLSIQRRFTNTTPDPITRLRFRVVDITTLNSPVVTAPQADLRVLSSTGTVTDSQNQTVATVMGLTLEQPPTQALGGGLNSSLTVIPPNGSLAAGNSIDVQFLLGVQAEGTFRFFVNVEALPATSTNPVLTEPTKAGASSKARAARNK